MVGPGGAFSNKVYNFRYVNAYSTSGHDVANLFTSGGDDTLSGTPTTSTLSGATYSNRANGFAQVNADASAGGNTKARLYDSALQALLLQADAANHVAQLSNADLSFMLAAKAFKQVSVFESNANDKNDPGLPDWITIFPPGP